MLAALLLALAVGSGPAAGDCLAFELSTSGRSGHGSAIMLESSPHQLIRALASLPAWGERSPGVASVRITALAAGPAINVIPARASAVIEVRLAAAGFAGEALGSLAAQTGPKVEIRALDVGCGPTG